MNLYRRALTAALLASILSTHVCAEDFEGSALEGASVDELLAPSETSTLELLELQSQAFQEGTDATEEASALQDTLENIESTLRFGSAAGLSNDEIADLELQASRLRDDIAAAEARSEANKSAFLKLGRIMGQRSDGTNTVNQVRIESFTTGVLGTDRTSVQQERPVSFADLGEPLSLELIGINDLTTNFGEEDGGFGQIEIVENGEQVQSPDGLFARSFFASAGVRDAVAEADAQPTTDENGQLINVTFNQRGLADLESRRLSDVQNLESQAVSRTVVQLLDGGAGAMNVELFLDAIGDFEEGSLVSQAFNLQGFAFDEQENEVRQAFEISGFYSALADGVESTIEAVFDSTADQLFDPETGEPIFPSDFDSQGRPLYSLEGALDVDLEEIEGVLTASLTLGFLAQLNLDAGEQLALQLFTSTAATVFDGVGGGVLDSTNTIGFTVSPADPDDRLLLGGGAIPEPSSLVLLAGLALGSLSRPRRRAYR